MRFPYHAAVGVAGEPYQGFPHSPPSSLCLSLLLPPALLKTTSAALKLLNNQHGPAPLTRLMCTHFPGTRRRLGGEFEEGATARGGEVGSSELARCLGHHHHHQCQPHPLRALGSLHVLGHPQSIDSEAGYNPYCHW